MSDSESFHHYLPVDDQSIDWGIYVTGAGRVVIRPGQPYPPPGHPGPYDFRWQLGRTLPEFQVLLVTDGHGLFESRETGTVTVNDGALMFLFPGVWHRYQPDTKTGWTERWFSFNGELVHRFMDHGPINSGSAVRKADAPDNVREPLIGSSATYTTIRRRIRFFSRCTQCRCLPRPSKPLCLRSRHTLHPCRRGASRRIRSSRKRSDSSGPEAIIPSRSPKLPRPLGSIGERSNADLPPSGTVHP